MKYKESLRLRKSCRSGYFCWSVENLGLELFCLPKYLAKNLMSCICKELAKFKQQIF